MDLKNTAKYFFKRRIIFMDMELARELLGRCFENSLKPLKTYGTYGQKREDQSNFGSRRPL